MSKNSLEEAEKRGAHFANGASELGKFAGAHFANGASELGKFAGAHFANGAGELEYKSPERFFYVKIL